MNVAGILKGVHTNRSCTAQSIQHPDPEAIRRWRSTNSNDDERFFHEISVLKMFLK
jgi:hypothetical protein